MNSRTIRLCYRKIIDTGAVRPWEKLVFEDSYQEFKMQFQYFNQQKKYHSFAEMAQEVQAAAKLQFLVSASVTGYIQQLHERIPDILNILGKHFLTFKNFRFEIVNSDVNDISKHRIAINFYSEPLEWYDTIDNYLLVADKSQAGGEEVHTHLFQLKPFLTIHTLKVNHETVIS
jgi:hypothetical protein